MIEAVSSYIHLSVYIRASIIRGQWKPLVNDLKSTTDVSLAGASWKLYGGCYLRDVWSETAVILRPYQLVKTTLLGQVYASI